MKRVIVSSLVVAFVFGVSFTTVLARPQYKKEFDAKYVKKDSTVPTEKAFAEVAETAKCLVCHGKNAEGKVDNKVRNKYGEALEPLMGKKNQKEVDKIIEALDKAAGEKSDSAKAGSPTFGELIKQGKLPAGDK